VRYQSIAGTATVFYLRRPYTAMEFLLDEMGQYASNIPPIWLRGGGLTITPASGVVDTEELFYQRLKFQGSTPAVTAVPILLDDEFNIVANLEDITTYSDGSAITAGKYHKIALLFIMSAEADARLLALRQAPPTGAEYATLEEARLDLQQLAATVAPSAYFANTIPLAYVYMQVGDASDLGTIDLRIEGFAGGGGGGGAVGNHSALVNLAADDHLQYIRTDGTRAFTGDIDLGGFEIANVGDVDGVDISAHVADADAHHVAFTPTDYSDARAYGNIYVTGGATAQAMASGVQALLTAYDTNGISLNTTPDHVNDRITVTNAGDYRITGSFTFRSSVSTPIEFAAAVGGVAGVIRGALRVRDVNQPLYVAFNGLVALGAGAVVTVRVTASGNTNLTVTESHLTVERL